MPGSNGILFIYLMKYLNMPKLINEASKHLPKASLPGTIIRVPINVNTGKFDRSALRIEKFILFYAFLKTKCRWQYLGRGFTA